ncbi:MAG: hypothetical protein AAB426_00940, partial [Myxococcota bacterium]
MPKSILIVDDDGQTLGALATVLEERGYAPMAIDAEDEPAEQFAAMAAELVFISLLAPNALGVCEKIRDHPDGAIVPIVLVGTGAESVSSPSAALAHGADYFFGLPLDHAKVVAKVQTYVGAGDKASVSVAPRPVAAAVPKDDFPTLPQFAWLAEAPQGQPSDQVLSDASAELVARMDAEAAARAALAEQDEARRKVEDEARRKVEDEARRKVED